MLVPNRCPPSKWSGKFDTHHFLTVWTLEPKKKKKKINKRKIAQKTYGSSFLEALY